MKLRINGNSVRLRLSQTEVESFALTGVCSNELTFPNGQVFTYQLQTGNDYAASYQQEVVTIELPKQEVNQWAGSAQVGIKAEVPIGTGGTLGILIEKDFQCLTNRDEDQSDLYPNPKDSH